SCRRSSHPRRLIVKDNRNSIRKEVLHLIKFVKKTVAIPNGPLECLNNHIKVLKRNAYGFRNFYNFKLRIMIRHGKTFLTK
ncbi:TPA: transposase, partial [Enterococcus faecium]